MSLCVCPACTDLLRQEGVEPASVIELVKSILDQTFAHAPDRPPKHPQTIQEIEDRSPEFKRFVAWRKKFSGALIGRIKNESLNGTSCKLLLQAGFDPGFRARTEVMLSCAFLFRKQHPRASAA